MILQLLIMIVKMIAIVLIMLKLKMMMKILNYIDNFKNGFIVLKIIKES